MPVYAVYLFLILRWQVKKLLRLRWSSTSSTVRRFRWLFCLFQICPWLQFTNPVSDGGCSGSSAQRKKGVNVMIHSPLSFSFSHLFVVCTLYYFTSFLVVSGQPATVSDELLVPAAIIELKKSPTSSLSLKWVLRQSFALDIDCSSLFTESFSFPSSINRLAVTLTYLSLTVIIVFLFLLACTLVPSSCSPNAPPFPEDKYLVGNLVRKTCPVSVLTLCGYLIFTCAFRFFTRSSRSGFSFP